MAVNAAGPTIFNDLDVYMKKRKLSIRSILFRLKQIGVINHKKVDFIVVGVQKAGTSAIRTYLSEHPEIEMSFSKEGHFFNQKIFSDSQLFYKWYEKDFKQSNKSSLFGEVTPILSYWEPSVERIWRYNKNMKLIAILRNPIDRAYSHWNMEKERGFETEEFLYCIQNENVRMRETLPHQHMYYSYIDRGYYSEQIRRIKRFFPENQVHFIKYEQFLADQKGVINRIFNFLGLSKVEEFTEKIIHQRPYIREMTNEEKQVLLNIYRNEISEVERLLGWDCSDWKK